MLIIRLPPADARRVESLSFSPDGQFLAALSSDHHLRIFSLQDGEIVRDHDFGGTFACQITYLSDGKRIVVSEDNLSVWEHEADRWFSLGASRLTGMHYAIHPDETLLASAGATSTITWAGIGVTLADLTSYKLIDIAPDSEYATGGIAFSPDGKYLASGHMVAVGQKVRHRNLVPGGVTFNEYEYVVRLREAKSARVLTTIDGWRQPIRKLMFDGESRFLVGACGPRLRVWDLKENREAAAYKPSSKHFQDMSTTPDGRYLVTVSNDKTVRLWDARSWVERTTYTWNIGRLLSVAISPDGLRLAAGSDKGKIVIWDLEE